MAEDKLILDVDVKPLKAQLKEANEALVNAIANFGDMSEEANEAAKKVAELKDTMADAAEAIGVVDPGKKFEAIAIFANQAAGAVSAVQGAMGLLGMEGEDLQKTMAKVQSAMALSQGLEQLKELPKSLKQIKLLMVDAFKPLISGSIIGATKLAGAAFKAFGVSVSTTSTSFKVLRGAIISTGIGALVVAIGYAVNKIMEWQEATEKAKEANDKLKNADEELEKQIAKTNDEIERRNTIRDFELAKEIALAKAAGKKYQDIRAIEDKFYADKEAKAQKQYDDDYKAVERFWEENLKGLKITNKETEEEVTVTAEEISLIKNNWYNKDLVDQKKYLDAMTEDQRNSYNALITQQQKTNDDMTAINRERSLVEANRLVEDRDKRKEAADKLKAAQKEADDIIWNAKLSRMTERGKAEKELEKKLQEDLKKIKLGYAKDKRYDEFVKLRRQQYNIDLAEIDKKFDDEEAAKKREKAEKERAFWQQINDIRYETKLMGIKDESEREKLEIEKSYADKRNQILNEEGKTFFAKFILLAGLEEQYKAQMAVKEEADKLIKDEKKIAELDELMNDESEKLRIRQEALDTEAKMNEEMFRKKAISEEKYTATKKKLAQAQKTIDQARLAQATGIADAIAGTIGALSQAAEEGTAEWKALKIAETTISTLSSIVNALQLGTKTSPPAVAIAQAVLTGVFGFMTVKQIIETEVPGDNGGGGGASAGVGGGGGGGAPQVPQLQTITNTPINAVFENLNQRQEPVKAFVVESEISASQNRVSDIERRSRF